MEVSMHRVFYNALHRNLKIIYIKMKQSGTFFLIYSLPVGLEDVSKYPDLFGKLRADGWSTEDLKKLAGENFIRVFKDVEKVPVNKVKTRCLET